MRSFLALAFAIALGATLPNATAQEDAFEAARMRLPEPAPGPAFPGAQSFEMSALCAQFRPRGRDRRIPSYLPRAAIDRGISGGAVLDCVFGDDGKFTTCDVVHEEPAGLGFARSAAAIACRVDYDLSIVGDGPPVGPSAGGLPPNTRLYRRNAEGEPWRARFPVRINVS